MNSLVHRKSSFPLVKDRYFLSVFSYDNAEYLSFPTIFCRQKWPDNREEFVKVYYSDICKYGLNCVHRHAARNVPNLFLKLKKLQMKHIFDKVTLAI